MQDAQHYILTVSRAHMIPPVTYPSTELRIGTTEIVHSMLFTCHLSAFIAASGKCADGFVECHETAKLGKLYELCSIFAPVREHDP